MGYPVYIDPLRVRCFLCNRQCDGIERESGFAARYGAFKQACPVCCMWTYYDRPPASLLRDRVERMVKAAGASVELPEDLDTLLADIATMEANAK